MLVVTEQDWETCTRPPDMIRHLRRTAGRSIERRTWFGHPSYRYLPRKWRLFLAGCCARILPAISDGGGRAEALIEFLDGCVERNPTPDARERVRTWFAGVVWNTTLTRLHWGLTTPVGMATGELRNIAGHAARTATPKPDKDTAQRRALDAEGVAQCNLLRCIFTNPFRTVTLDSGWITPTVKALVKGIYQAKAFDRMPILADALEEAGCDNADVLNHCRGTGPHVRGCWVVDQVLEKK